MNVDGNDAIDRVTASRFGARVRRARLAAGVAVAEAAASINLDPMDYEQLEAGDPGLFADFVVMGLKPLASIFGVSLISLFEGILEESPLVLPVIS